MKVSHQAMRELLTSVGPLTAREAAEFFSASSHVNVSAVLSTMRHGARKQVYIESWTRDIGQGKSYLRPVYALGSKPDARKPRPVTNAEKCRRWKAKQRVPKVNSVWAWASQA